jgi:hypothetical protein
MANEYARNIKDSGYSSTFALPTQVGEANGKTSSIVDMGADVSKLAQIECELLVPTFSSTIAPSGSTAGVYYEVQFSTSSTFNGSILKRYQENFVGTGIDQQTVRHKPASNSPRYVRGKVWLGTTCTDASAVTGTFSLNF